METFRHDLRYALRGIIRAPFLSFVVLLALSAGIGLNAAVFALVDSAWFRPPVKRDPASFVQIIPSYSGWFDTEKEFDGFSVKDYEAVSTRVKSLREVAAYTHSGSAQWDDDSAHAHIWLITCNFFHAYGWQQPVMGRLFLSDECATPGAGGVAVISDALWKTRYGTDPHIIGRSVRLNHRPYIIVGVVHVRGPVWMRGDAWVPYTMQAEFWDGYDAFKHSDYPWLHVVGRLAPGYSPADARAELQTIENQQDHLIPGRKTKLLVTNGSMIRDPDARSLGLVIIPLVMGPMVLILLVACINVAMLLLSRAAERRGEVAIRVALGAGRRRLLRMLATEGLVIAAAAGVISIYVARKLPGVLWSFLLRNSSYQDLGLDWRVFAYLAGAALLAGLIAGLAPARETLKVDLLTSLKGREGTVMRSRMHSALIIAQMAMSFVLVAAGVMFARIQHSITADDRGFEMRQVFVIPLSTSSSKYTPESAAVFYRAVRERVLEIRGVRSASYTDTPPFMEPPSEEIRVPGESQGQGQHAVVEQVSTDFFTAMDIGILRGRAFRDSDATSTASGVAIVSRTFASDFWNGQDPLGKVVILPDNTQVLVVGMARDVKSSNLDNPNEARLYLPQSPRAFTGSLLVRFDGEPHSLAPAISQTVRILDQTQWGWPRTLYSMREEQAALEQPFTELVLLMALLTVLLAVSGVYGTVAFSVSQRTCEFGICMALGATRGHILRSVLASGIRQIAIGLFAGLLLALPAAFVLWHLVRAFAVFDWTTYAVAAFALTTASLCAYYIPARRATRVDPMVALKYE